jgi:hypothetical protein
MPVNYHKKTTLAIFAIGSQRFWMGILLGLGWAVSLFLLFNCSFEALRFLSSAAADLVVPNDREWYQINLFFAALAVVFGFSITMWIWMQGTHLRKVHRHYAGTNALFISFVVLTLLFRVGFLFFLVPYGLSGYDGQMDLLNEHWLFFVLLPLVVFFHVWLVPQRIYFARKWLVVSFLFCCGVSLFIAEYLAVNPKIVNETAQKRFDFQYQLLAADLQAAEDAYGLQFDPLTIAVLKQWHTARAMDQMACVNAAFSKQLVPSLDTIVLQKMLLKMFKYGQTNCCYESRNWHWSYAFPADVFRHLQAVESDSAEGIELAAVLDEMWAILNTPRMKWQEESTFSAYEIQRSRAAQYEIPDTIRESLLAICSPMDFSNFPEKP